jgi:hypothetical protein
MTDVEDNVVKFPGDTFLDIPVNDMLSNIINNEELETAVVIGARPDGSMFLASSTGDLYKMLWFIEVGKQEVLEMGT